MSCIDLLLLLPHDLDIFLRISKCSSSSNVILLIFCYQSLVFDSLICDKMLDFPHLFLKITLKVFVLQHSLTLFVCLNKDHYFYRVFSWFLSFFEKVYRFIFKSVHFLMISWLTFWDCYIVEVWFDNLYLQLSWSEGDMKVWTFGRIYVRMRFHFWYFSIFSDEVHDFLHKFCP